MLQLHLTQRLVCDEKTGASQELEPRHVSLDGTTAFPLICFVPTVCGAVSQLSTGAPVVFLCSGNNNI